MVLTVRFFFFCQLLVTFLLPNAIEYSGFLLDLGYVIVASLVDVDLEWYLGLGLLYSQSLAHSLVVPSFVAVDLMGHLLVDTGRWTQAQSYSPSPQPHLSQPPRAPQS